MKLRAAELRGILRNSSEAEYPPSLATGELRTGYSPRLHPQSKLRGIRRRRIKNSPDGMQGLFFLLVY